jgi:ribosomal protein S18 acetylase RimI-like enzyme
MTVSSIRTASHADLTDVGQLLGVAFQQDPISTWLFPDAARRREVQKKFFQAFATLALDSGGVIYLTDDQIATTVWFDSEADGDEDDFMARFDMLTPAESETFGQLAGWMADNHPTRGAHMHLQFIGVHPDYQRSGIGGTLLRHNLALLDEQGTPAYLEASSTLSPPLYQRKGFEHIGTPFGPEPGPKLYPMWREPKS